eukprot:scaffold2479_cov146-Isochrysis_galbana.AAC.3
MNAQAGQLTCRLRRGSDCELFLSNSSMPAPARPEQPHATSTPRIPIRRERLRAAPSAAASFALESPASAVPAPAEPSSSSRSESWTETTPSVSRTTESHLVYATGFLSSRRVASNDATSLS